MMDIKIISFFILSCVAASEGTSGRLSAEILEKHPRLTFLGNFNGKEFYLERAEANRYTANTGCRELGLQLAQFDSQDEIDFVVQAGAPDSWTGGENVNTKSGFQWSSGDSISANVIFQDHLRLGLILSVGTRAYLTPFEFGQRFPYLCSS